MRLQPSLTPGQAWKRFFLAAGAIVILGLLCAAAGLASPLAVVIAMVVALATAAFAVRFGFRHRQSILSHPSRTGYALAVLGVLLVVLAITEWIVGEHGSSQGLAAFSGVALVAFGFTYRGVLGN